MTKVAVPAISPSTPPPHIPVTKPVPSSIPTRSNQYTPTSASARRPDNAQVIITDNVASADIPMEQSKSNLSSSLEVPSPEKLREIAERQDAKAKEIQERRKKEREAPGNVDGKDKQGGEERNEAARLIQKNYRGYRARRALQGYGLDSNARWVEVLKEAKYHNKTKTMSRDEHLAQSPSNEAQVRSRWKRVGTIAHHAGSDDTESDSDFEDAGPEELAKLKERKRRQKKEREKYAKIMGIDYFLEMVDHKHRYGSNLRRYHVEWKKSDTKENFFYWLDHGEGKDLDLEDRPRSRLDSEFVRYLSKEDRQQYLVRINEQGLFCWVKNGELITTSVDYRDSIHGIVPIDDKTPTWREVTTGQKEEPDLDVSDSSSLSGTSTGGPEDSSKYVNTSLHEAKGLSKVTKLDTEAIKNHMLRKTTKKNTWIFVADTSFRMFIGIKQSGQFQHSSFLRGARVAAAGLIKIKNGQLRKLSPLSGHYSPPVKNFREFLKSLQSSGADLSRLNTSRSYAVLLGLEGYLGAKKRVKGAEQGVKDVFNPDKKKEREEAAKDKSQSAAREREILRQQEMEKRKRSLSYRLRQRLGLGEDEQVSEGGEQKPLSSPSSPPQTPGEQQQQQQSPVSTAAKR